MSDLKLRIPVLIQCPFVDNMFRTCFVLVSHRAERAGLEKRFRLILHTFRICFVKFRTRFELFVLIVQ